MYLCRCENYDDQEDADAQQSRRQVEGVVVATFVWDTRVGADAGAVAVHDAHEC